MANFALTLCLCIYTIGSTSGAAFTSSSATTLTITFSDTNILFICSVGSDDVDALDKYAVTKDGATAVFQADADEALGTWNANDVTRTVPKADFTTADYGSYTCALQLADGSVTSASSSAVVLPACSSAPRIVDSLTLALVCLMATVVKAKY